MVYLSALVFLLSILVSIRRIVGPGSITEVDKIVTPNNDKRCSLNGYGKLTRSTDECVCLTNNCEGKGCIFEQGLAFFPYSKCRDCRCIPKKSSYSQEDEKGRSRIPNMKQTHPSYPNDGNSDTNADDDDSNKPTTLADVVDYLVEISPIVFGIAVSLFMVLLAYIFIATNRSAKTSTQVDVRVKETQKAD